MDTITKHVNADQAAGLIPSITDSFIEPKSCPNDGNSGRHCYRTSRHAYGHASQRHEDTAPIMTKH